MMMILKKTHQVGLLCNLTSSASKHHRDNNRHCDRDTQGSVRERDLGPPGFQVILLSRALTVTLAKSCDPSRASDYSRSRARCRHSGVQTMPRVVASVVPQAGCGYALWGWTSTILPI
eukprot:1856744-Rhodomonas_salina.1